MADGAFGFLFLFGCIYFSKYFVLSQDVIGTEAHDAEVRLKSDLLSNYTKDVLPPHNASSPVMVVLGLTVLKLKDLDARKQTLTTESWLKLEWNDSRLIWDPKDNAGITALHFAPHKLWQPDVKLYNSANVKKMEVQTETFKVVRSNGEVVWIPPVSIHSLCEVDLKHYPYDRHTCTYKFASWTHDGQHVDFKNEMRETNGSISVDDSWITGGEWEIVDTFALKSMTYYNCCTEGYPDVTFSVVIQRRSTLYSATIMCPLTVATLLILASFWVSPKSFHRIMLNIFSLLTTFILLIHLSSTLPAVGNSCPLVVTFTGILFLVSAVATVISMIFMRIPGSTNNGHIPEFIRRIARSSVMKFCCITIPALDNDRGNDSMKKLVVEDDLKNSRNIETSNYKFSLMFLTLIDRLLFIICLIIIVAFMISASA